MLAGAFVGLFTDQPFPRPPLSISPCGLTKTAENQCCCSRRAGLYKMPWDMTTLGHRQYNPLFVLRKAAAFVQARIPCRHAL